MLIDPTSSIGKVRLRVADYNDLPLFPDEVYQSTLDDCDGNVVRAAKMMAQYILGVLSMRTHEKMVQLEVWGSDYSKNYLAFLKATILNPSLMTDAPIPYAAGIDVTHPLLQFQEDWNLNYRSGTQSEQLNSDALGTGSIDGWSY